MTENTPAGAPIQHLGAASREYEEPESLDGDFVSSAEADAAERAAEADYDTELTERDLQAIFDADTAAREAENWSAMGAFETDGYERENQERSSGEAIFSQARAQEARAEEAAFGSTPSPSAQPKAVTSAQTPGHIGSMPMGPLYADTGRAAEQPASSGGTAATLDDEIARMEQYAQALRQRRQEQQYWAEVRAKQQRLDAFHRVCEQLETDVSHVVTPFITRLAGVLRE